MRVPIFAHRLPEGAGGTAASICRIDDRAHPHTALQCKAARKQMGSACP